jgi:hypothetical protein
VLIRANSARYAPELHELNDCIDQFRAADIEIRKNVTLSPPFASLGTLDPPSTCKLFLEKQRDEMTIAELISKAKRINDWNWTNCFKPRFMYYVSETSGGIVSSMYDYGWQAKYFDTSVFSALSVEEDACETHEHCTAYARSATVEIGSPSLRDTLPKDPKYVRTDYIVEGEAYLFVDVPTNGTLKNLKIIFPYDEDHTEIVRMVHPFIGPQLDRITPLSGTALKIKREDGGLTKVDFALNIFTQAALDRGQSPIAIIGFIILAILVLLGFIDGCAWVARKLRKGRDEIAGRTAP